MFSKFKRELLTTKECLNELVFNIPYRLATFCGISDLTMAHFTTTESVKVQSICNIAYYSIGEEHGRHRVEAAYQALKKYVLDKGVYVSFSMRLLLLSNTGLYNFINYEFRNDAQNTPSHRHVDLLAYVVDSLLNPHPEQAKDEPEDLHPLWVYAMTSAIWVGKTEQAVALLKKYPEFLEKENGACSVREMEAVSGSVLLNVSKTADEGVLTRFLQHPEFLVNDPKVPSLLERFKQNDAWMAKLRAKGCLEYRPNLQYLWRTDVQFEEAIKGGFSEDADFEQTLVTKEYQFLQHLIEKAYAGVENLKPLEDIFNLLSLSSIPAFSQADYTIFFDNKPHTETPPEHLYKVHWELQQFLGKLKMALGSTKCTDNLALENVLKRMRVNVLGSLMAPILHKKQHPVSLVVEQQPTSAGMSLSVPVGVRFWEKAHVVSFKM